MSSALPIFPRFVVRLTLTLAALAWVNLSVGDGYASPASAHDLDGAVPVISASAKVSDGGDPLGAPRMRRSVHRDWEHPLQVRLPFRSVIDLSRDVHDASVSSSPRGAACDYESAGNLRLADWSKATRGGLAEARAARDALSAELAPLKGKAPATVTGGYNTRTGEVADRACGGGKCAETHVVEALGGNKAEVGLTEAVRPRTGLEVPVCPSCEATYGRGAFPPGTRFKSD
jgi:hypothetical protein